MKELVSVIIPVYNTAQYLDKSVHSVVSQSYDKLQIILIDDGAKDNSPQMCDVWAQKDKRIQVIHKENEGLGLTRNCGLDNATGKYVCFLDSDDTLELNTIEVCVEILEKKQADACFYPRKTFNANGEFEINKNVPHKLEFIDDEVKNEFSKIYFGQLPQEKEEPFIHPSICRGMFLNETIQKNGLRFQSERVCLSEDVVFGLEFCKVAKYVIIIPQYYYNYTYNASSLTKAYNPKRLQLYKNLYNIMIQYKDYYNKVEGLEYRIQHKFISGVQQCIEMEVKTKKLRGWKQTYLNVKKICNDAEVRDIFLQCPISLVNKKRKYFIEFVLKKRILTLCIFYFMK